MVLPFTGKVLAGNTAIVGASVQVYAAGTTGNGSAPTQLFSNAFTTASDGSFEVTGSYTCPTANSILYLVARGGVIGSGSDKQQCRADDDFRASARGLDNTPSFVIDEVTTVASAYALSPFLAAGAALGAAATNTTGIQNGTAMVAALVNLNTGKAPGASSLATNTALLTRINTLSNLLSACLTTPNKNCASLYAATTNGTDIPGNDARCDSGADEASCEQCRCGVHRVALLFDLRSCAVPRRLQTGRSL